MTYQEIVKRISMYQAEINALNNLRDAQGQSMDDLIAKEKAGTITAAEESILNNMARGSLYTGSMATGQLGQLQAAKSAIDAIFDSGSGGANFGGGGNVSGGGSSYMPSGGGGGSKSAEDAAKAAEQLREQMVSNVKDVEQAITDIIKKEYEKRKQAIEDEYTTRKESLQKQKDLYDQQDEEDTYNKDLKKEQESLNQLKASETNARRDTSLAGQARLKDILQQEQDQQDKIDQMVHDHTKSRNDQAFDDQMNMLDKEKDAQEKALDNQYSDENISKMVNQAMYNGSITGIGNVLDAYKTFQNTYNEGLTASGQIMQKEFIDKWQQIQSLIKGTSGVSIGVNFGSLPKYDVGTPQLTSDQAAIVHKNEAIIPAKMNPFRGGEYLSKFLNYTGISTPKMSNSNKQLSLNINTPLISVTGGVNSDVMTRLENFATKIKDDVTSSIMKEFNNQAIYQH